ncbi:hypothetical protein [Kitasatospora sp. NPDC058478]|uniref:hypothetical protein n=1 Tax=unclassified Kitasatospora TaxID=2633591 RepID=UPI003658EE10
MPASPHREFYDGRRGCTTLTLERHQVRAGCRALSHITRPGGTITTAASFVTEAGNPGIRPA